MDIETLAYEIQLYNSILNKLNNIPIKQNASGNEEMNISMTQQSKFESGQKNPVALANQNPSSAHTSSGNQTYESLSDEAHDSLDRAKARSEEAWKKYADSDDLREERMRQLREEAMQAEKNAQETGDLVKQLTNEREMRDANRRPNSSVNLPRTKQNIAAKDPAILSKDSGFTRALESGRKLDDSVLQADRARANVAAAHAKNEGLNQIALQRKTRDQERREDLKRLDDRKREMESRLLGAEETLKGMEQDIAAKDAASLPKNSRFSVAKVNRARINVASLKAGIDTLNQKISQLETHDQEQREEMKRAEADAKNKMLESLPMAQNDKLRLGQGEQDRGSQRVDLVSLARSVPSTELSATGPRLPLRNKWISDDSTSTSNNKSYFNPELQVGSKVYFNSGADTRAYAANLDLPIVEEQMSANFTNKNIPVVANRRIQVVSKKSPTVNESFSGDSLDTVELSH